MLWPLSKKISKDTNISATRPATRITKNFQYLSNYAQPHRIILNEVDFRLCIIKARIECHEQKLEVDQWIQPETVFEFVFCKEQCNCVAFEGIHTTVSNTKHEDHIIDAKWRSLHEYYLKHNKMMKRTCDLARELVKMRAEADLELGEDPVVIEVEEAEEDGVWVGKEDWN